MQAATSGEPAQRATFARFRSMESCRDFLVSGVLGDDGLFTLDEEVEQWAGPFATFAADGSTARFLGLDNLRLV